MIGSRESHDLSRTIRRAGPAVPRFQPLRSALALAFVLVSGCVINRSSPPPLPEDEARHRAALSLLTVNNRTDQPLTIAFRSATPPTQEVVVGTVSARGRERVAPIPAGEPIILLARKPGGTELILAPRSYTLDAEWIWDIPASAVFRLP